MVLDLIRSRPDHQVLQLPYRGQGHLYRTVTSSLTRQNTKAYRQNHGKNLISASLSLISTVISRDHCADMHTPEFLPAQCSGFFIWGGFDHDISAGLMPPRR